MLPGQSEVTFEIERVSTCRCRMMSRMFGAYSAIVDDRVAERLPLAVPTAGLKPCATPL
jgi:hypothetical protein